MICDSRVTAAKQRLSNGMRISAKCAVPKVVRFYRLYSYAVILFNLTLLGIAIWFLSFHTTLANELVPAWLILTVGFVTAPLSLALLVFSLWALRIGVGGKAWTWHLTNISLGLGTIILVPIALPLFFLWFRDDVKQYYGHVRPPHL